MKKYVISCLARKDVLGDELENGEWRYAGIDDGRMGSGYPCMVFSLMDAKKFSSIGEAEEWFKENGRYLFDTGVDYDYDMDTLGIHKVETKFTLVKRMTTIR